MLVPKGFLTKLNNHNVDRATYVIQAYEEQIKLTDLLT